MENIHAFLTRLRGSLTNAVIKKHLGSYIDLAETENLESIEQLSGNTFPEDNLITFQEILMEEISKCNCDKVKMGINELLKNLLITINKEHEHYLAERHLYRLRMIFKRCLMPDFPFPEDIWNYTCDCLRSTGAFLAEKGYYIAVQEIIDSLASMGRIAASKALPTSNTQASLRILENIANEKQQSHLASRAKNARFNLET